jgi:hypothetical protein
MIRTLQHAVSLPGVACCTINSVSAEHNDLNKVLSAVILEMNNEGVFAEYCMSSCTLFCPVLMKTFVYQDCGVARIVAVSLIVGV